MGKPTIHGAGPSPFVRKVRVALIEKGIDYTLVPVMPGDSSPAFRKLSPLGKIPVYQDGDFALPDSSCILAYLERVHPEPALFPRDPQLYGRALWFEEYSDSKLSENLGAFFFQRFVRKHFQKQEPDEEMLAKKKTQDLPALFDYLEAQIGDRDVLVGSHFGVADIAVTSIFLTFQHAGESVDAKRWPRLAAYLERHHARPSFKGLIEEERKFFAAMGG